MGHKSAVTGHGVGVRYVRTVRTRVCVCVKYCFGRVRANSCFNLSSSLE